MVPPLQVYNSPLAKTPGQQTSHEMGGYMDSCIKVARLYRGKEEIEDLPPLTVKQEPDNTTSPMATETAIPKAADTEPSYDSEPEAEEYKGEDAEDYALQEEFFKEPNPKTIRHKWLVLFYRWLKTADAGRKKDRNCLQHTCHISKLCLLAKKC